MSEHYRLPLETLLMVMSDMNAVSFHADLSDLPGVAAKGNYRVELVLNNGQIHSCHILLGKQVLLHSQAAIQALREVGDIEWNLASTVEVPFPQSTPSWQSRLPHSEGNEPGVIPYRTTARADMQSLTRHARIVWALVDGIRDISTIALLLHLSLEDALQALTKLHEGGLIEW